MGRDSEASVLRGCRHILNILQNNGLLLYRRMNLGGIPRQVRGKIRFMKNECVGMADLLVLIKNGPTLHIEVKSPKGRLSKEQIKWRDELTAIGHQYCLVRSPEDLEAVLLNNGVSHWSFNKRVDML